MAKGDKPDGGQDIPSEVAKHSPRERLPQSLQRLVDNEEHLGESIYDGTANESTESNIRYAAYATRIRTILLSAHRYVAYTSDIGESFRPVAHPYLVRGAYGISWAYIAGDVSYEGYKAYLRNQRVLHPERQPHEASKTSALTTAVETTAEKIAEPIASTLGAVVPETSEGKPVPHVPALEDYRTVMAQRAIFQAVASMGFPAFTIHSIVKYSGKALRNAKNTTIRTYGPIGLGLAAVPFLPYLFDKPIEEAVEWSFHRAFLTIGGPSAVGHAPSMGREDALHEKIAPPSHKEKEKEL
ncbi:MAG: hypothetical protein M1819_003176 [Sarea resinae]|nr:MAG: hypothetical protein M1819_003176 [Sarea resinae]